MLSLRRATRWSIAIGVAIACGCGADQGPTITLRRVTPAADTECGAAADGQTILITALGDFAAAEATAASHPIALDASLEIASFPADTRVLTVQVIGTGGVIRTAGRTAEVDLEALSDGDEIFVFMAPPRGFCPTGPPVTARDGGLMARAGAGALLAGGTSGGVPVRTVERYHPTTGSFEDLGEALYGDDTTGLIGASMTTLDDGRVVVAGGATPAYQVYDPIAGRFEAARLLSPARAHHAAVALPGGRLLLAGGCSSLDASGACVPGSALATTTIVDVVGESVQEGPALTVPRWGAVAIREPSGGVLLIGGRDDTGAEIDSAERIDPAGGAGSELVPSASGNAAALAAGGTLIAFGSGGSPSTAAVVLPAGEGSVTTVTPALLARDGASLTALEDGRVLVLGGLAADTGDEVMLYLPNQGRFDELPAAPMRAGAALRRSGHRAVLLDDGTVLIAGGHDLGGGALDDAWIFRPDLTGPFTSDVTMSFSDPDLAGLVVPRDPAQSTFESDPSRYRIRSTGGGSGLPSEWAVIAGPRFVEATVEARLRSDGGAAVLLSFTDAANHRVLALLPRQAAALFEISEGQAAPVTSCTATLIDTLDLTALVDLSIELSADGVRATLDGIEVLRCTDLAPARGLVGVGVIGDPGEALDLTALSVQR